MPERSGLTKLFYVFSQSLGELLVGFNVSTNLLRSAVFGFHVAKFCSFYSFDDQLF